MFRIFTRQSVACSLTPVKWVFHRREGKDCETIKKLKILRKNADVEGCGHLPKLRRGLRSMDTDKPFTANRYFELRDGIAGDSMQGGGSVLTN